HRPRKWEPPLGARCPAQGTGVFLAKTPRRKEEGWQLASWCEVSFAFPNGHRCLCLGGEVRLTPLRIAISLSIVAGNKIPVAFEEIHFAKTFLRFPSQVVKDAVDDLTLVAAYTKKDQLDRPLAGIGKLVASDLAGFSGADRQLLLQLSDYRLFGCFSRLHLA